MGNIIVIGTIHTMLPRRKRELMLLLEKINPDQILVEISRKDLKTKKTKNYPKEMLFAYKWGLKHGKKINGFDCSINIDNKFLTKKEEKVLMNKLSKEVGKYNWKEHNRRNHDREHDSILYKLIDKKKHKLRQNKMLSNINKMTAKEGKVLVLTGAGHLLFFEKHLKGAIFPFRK